MKKSIKYLLALILAVSLTACENYFGDINTDPDEPIEVTPSVLLTQVELRLAYTYWGDFSRFGSVFSGQVDGTGRQFAVIDKYNLQGNDVDAVWANCYSGILMDNRQIQRLAEDGGFKHYSGISKAIEAYTVMVMTDYWGDIPYSEALQGNGVEVSQPKFDSQEDVYNAIFALINEARADLDADNGGNAPGADDLIYAGDIDAWKAFLNVLEARGKLHLGKVSAANYDAALAALDKGGLTSDASVPFGSGSTENAPWYQYTDQRDDIDLGAAYIALYDTSSVDTIFASPDPRASVYTTPIEFGVSHPVFTPNRLAPLLSKTEELFIRAEAEFAKNGAVTSSYDAYKAAIQNSFADAGVSADFDAYWTYIDKGEASLTLNLIMTEKYKALLCNPEVFTDYRRTGVPSLKPKAGSEVPSRFPYPDTETLANSNTPSPADVTLFTKVWWDK